jgi:type II pantothenate kinase
MNAEKYNLDRIYFGGCFIRGMYPCFSELTPHSIPVIGHAATITTLSYAIRFWSKGTKRALFLRHEGFLYGLYNLSPLDMLILCQWRYRSLDQKYWRRG